MLFVPVTLAVEWQVITCVLRDLLQTQMKCFLSSLPCATALAAGGSAVLGQWVYAVLRRTSSLSYHLCVGECRPY
jgi:hypothetical protein